jgi:hypothetical protein
MEDSTFQLTKIISPLMIYLLMEPPVFLQFWTVMVVTAFQSTAKKT